MSTMSTRQPAGEMTAKEGFAMGTAFVAATLLFTAGVIGLLQGIAAVAEDVVFVAGSEYIYRLDLTTWGWIHIVVSAIAIAIAVGLFTGATWARAGAIVIAALSIILTFLWLPYYPWWSILVIAVDLVVIWAVATWQVAE